MRFNLLLIDCVKTKGFKHTVFSISMLNYKLIKEVIFVENYEEIIGPEWVEEFRKDPKVFVEKYQ
jgi:hypothetical protein